MVYYLSENLLDIFPLVFYKYFVYDKCTSSSNRGSFDQKTWKSPEKRKFKQVKIYCRSRDRYDVDF